MPKIGPFFYFRGRLLYHAVDISQGRPQAGKLDDPLGHDILWDKTVRAGDYIDCPRGRVVWDEEQKRAIIYIDRCIDKEEIVAKIVSKYELDAYEKEYDEHYRCKNCVGDPFR